MIQKSSLYLLAAFLTAQLVSSQASTSTCLLCISQGRVWNSSTKRCDASGTLSKPIDCYRQQQLFQNIQQLDIDATARFPVKLTMNMDSARQQEWLVTSTNRLDKPVYVSVQCYPDSKYQLYAAVGATLVSVD